MTRPRRDVELTVFRALMASLDVLRWVICTLDRSRLIRRRLLAAVAGALLVGVPACSRTAGVPRGCYWQPWPDGGVEIACTTIPAARQAGLEWPQFEVVYVGEPV